MQPNRRPLLRLGALLACALAGCDEVPDTTHAAMPTPPVLVGAGDIAGCAWTGDEATARILDTIPGTVFTTGDNAYDKGKLREFRECYEPSWGRHRTRTRPAIGNHDLYAWPRGRGYFAYFGDAAGPGRRGYYSYDLGTWHVVVLNHNAINDGESTSDRGAQARWLRADLAAHPTRCTVAYWHAPRFSSSGHGSDTTSAVYWRILHRAGADVVLAGHDHIYERFAPQTPTGAPDAARGIRQFTVGTGGARLYAVGRAAANSEFRLATTLGVLRLDLDPGRYRWSFIGVDGVVHDAGAADCH